jgi:hypothetical protein
LLKASNLIKTIKLETQIPANTLAFSHSINKNTVNKYRREANEKGVEIIMNEIKFITKEQW